MADRDRLREIKTFPQLVKYLRDELEWPVEADDFEELTFDYEPEELGIDAKTAAKIDEIKQLRPLVTNQPWAIFFVKFEPKRLPVIALRRILSRLVIKKRASARRSELASWSLNDLLFISNYGEGNQRQITFAHFSQDYQMGDLPTLKVLGWDDEDTVLHLEHAHNVLKEKLRWPKDTRQVNEWREQWASIFTLRYKEVITTSKDLAIQLAHLATAIRKRVSTVLNIESENGPLRKLMNAFKQALIHDLYEEAFADMYAQTITYGLLSARVSRPAGLVADNLTDMVPVTNPFLKELLSTFLTLGGRKGKIDFDELGINEVVHALRNANMEAVLRDFGDRNPQEDPVIHFYELFLKEYNPKLRIQRGVFYTPRPVVSFIVRSVDEILRSDFGLEDGLADTTTWGEMLKRFPEMELPGNTKPEDPFVQVLDPALGTGTFLVEVIDVIHKTMTAKWQKAGYPTNRQKQLWNEYVPKHLLPRLYGFELLMAPYTIAHMKISLKLYETGYRFVRAERTHIYLTNSLEAPQDFSDRLAFAAPALAHEAKLVNEVKQYNHFTIIIGNPPYSNFSANLSPAARQLVQRYKEIDGQPIKERNALQLERNVNDDNLKFFAKGEDLLSASRIAVFGMISNASYLDAATLRGVRARLLKIYESVAIFDLGGSTDLTGSGTDRVIDENVFDISQPVAISLMFRKQKPLSRSSIVKYCALRGARESKFITLLGKLSTDDQENISVLAPHYTFVPRRESAGWHSWFPIDEALGIFAEGLKTGFDQALVGMTQEELRKNLEEFVDRSISSASLREIYGVLGKGWAHNLFSNRPVCARRAEEALRRPFVRFPYRPFDYRWIPWPSKLLKATSVVAGQHLQHKNLCLIVARQVSGPESVSHFYISRSVPDARVFYSKKGTATYFPILRSFGGTFFTERFTKEISNNLKLPWQDYIKDINEAVSPFNVVHYIYAVFHSPAYRAVNSGSLKQGFPKIPLTANENLFDRLSDIGADLVALHLMEDEYNFASWNVSKSGTKSPMKTPITDFVGKGHDEVCKGYPQYSEGAVWINPTQRFHDVSPDVWKFQIGGYQVCEKWLKDRKGRVLSNEDINHYHKIVVAINETIRLMDEIDKVIEKHGGWPNAFTTSKT